MKQSRSELVSKWIDHAFWALLTGSCTFGVHVLSKMSDSIDRLNVAMATMVADVKAHEAGDESRAQEFDLRIRNLETAKRREAR